MEVWIRFLTPGFVYGADQTNAEFRIKSLIGQMRYWWRMTKKWPNSDKEAGKLLQKEATVFGFRDTGAKPFYLYMKKDEIEIECSKKQTRKKSKVRLQSSIQNGEIDDLKERFRSNISIEGDMLIWNGFMTCEQRKMLIDAKPNDNSWRDTINELYRRAHRFVYSEERNGLSYLFFPFYQGRQESFTWIGAGSEVTLELEFKRNIDKEIKQEVLLSLFLVSRFGGLGSRSRRGAGALEIKVDGCDLFDCDERDVANSVNGKGNKGDEYFSRIETESPLWHSLTNPKRNALVVGNFYSWNEALDHLGKTLGAFRTGGRPSSSEKAVLAPRDFKEETAALYKYYSSKDENDLPKSLSKAAFGLPIIVNFVVKVRGRRKFVPGAITIAPFKDNMAGRRGSPLHVTVNRPIRHNGDEEYYLTLIVLWDHVSFLPSNMPIKLKHKHKHKKIKNIAALAEVENPSPDKIEDFLRILCRQKDS